jgi:hypothetical protein
MFAVVIAAEGLPIWGPLPMIVGEVGALILLSVAASKHLEPDGENLAGDGQPAARHTA